MKAVLERFKKRSYWVDSNGEEQEGAPPSIYGDVSYVFGDLSHVSGDLKCWADAFGARRLQKYFKKCYPWLWVITRSSALCKCF